MAVVQPVLCTPRVLQNPQDETGHPIQSARMAARLDTGVTEAEETNEKNLVTRPQQSF